MTITDPHSTLKHPLRALVVDDDVRWRTLVSEILNDVGCQVTALAGPPVPASDYHLAVLDVGLNPNAPEKHDGLALIDRLPHTPILFLSGITDPHVIAQIQHRPNVLGFLSKGLFRREDLFEFVQKVATGDTRSTPAIEALKVLIVEDDARWCTVYEDILELAGFQPQYAISYGEARGWLQRSDFALAIVDLHLISSADPQENRDGFWLLRAARQRGVPTIVVSALGEPEDIDRAYDEFGVFAFVEKEGFDRRTFRSMVEEAIKTPPATGLPTGSEAAAPVQVDKAPSADGPLAELTERERDVLAFVTRGYTNRQIAEALRITPNTVKKHVDHILQKLGASNRAAAVAAALRAGLNTPGDK